MSLASGSIDLKSLKVAGSSATSYITTIDGGGIKVHDSGNSNNYIQLTSSAINFFDGVGLAGSINLKGASYSENYRQVINNQEQLRFNHDFQAAISLDYPVDNGIEVVMTINDIGYTFSVANDGTSVTRNISGYGNVTLQYDSNEQIIIITNENATIIQNQTTKCG